jgi:hypothetical protein
MDIRRAPPPVSKGLESKAKTAHQVESQGTANNNNKIVGIPDSKEDKKLPDNLVSMILSK